MDTPFTSFIVPVYNTPQWLEECAASILGQSNPALELILVDDGSTDGSAEICRRIAAADPRARAFTITHRGLGGARNYGVAQARGSWVVFVDSDDTVHPDFLQVMLQIQADTSAGAVLCRHTTRPGRLSVKGRVTTLDVPTLIRRILYQDGYDCSLCGRLLPTQALLAAPMREGVLYEDLDAFYRIYGQIAPCEVASTTAPLYYYRQHQGSIIHTFTPDRLDVLDVTDRICRHYADDAALEAAARDRRFSAAYNMLVLSAHAGLHAEADRCWQIITADRHDELRDPRVRLKNKLGAMLSHLGRPVVTALGRLVY